METANGRWRSTSSISGFTKMLFPGKKLSSPRPEPPGFESRFLKSLPQSFLWGTLFILEPSIFARLMDWNPANIDLELTITSIDIAVVATLVLYWTVLFTTGLAAVIIKVMKGYRYEADSYPLQDSERPYL